MSWNKQGKNFVLIPIEQLNKEAKKFRISIDSFFFANSFLKINLILIIIIPNPKDFFLKKHLGNSFLLILPFLDCTVNSSMGESTKL